MSVGAVNKQTGDRIPTAGMPAIDDALDLTSVNPVQNAIVTAALALKQDKTDNSLQTTDKTVVGGINELKSGLTNVNSGYLSKQFIVINGTSIYDFVRNTKTPTGYIVADVQGATDNPIQNATSFAIIYKPIANGNYSIVKIEKGGQLFISNVLLPNDTEFTFTEFAKKRELTNLDVALSVPDGTGKNVLPLTLANLKSFNPSGTWDGNAYTYNGVTFTAQMDDDGNVTGITANGTASGESDFYLEGKVSKTKYSGCIMSGCVGGSDSTYYIQYIQESSPWKNQKQTNDTIQLSEFPENINVTIRIVVSSGVELTDKAFYPMIRPATITDPTFAPYIPSVDARLDAVENKIKTDTFSGTTDAYGNVDLNNYRYILTAYAGGYICIPFEYNYNRYIKVLSTTTFEPVTNTNVSGSYTYINS